MDATVKTITIEVPAGTDENALVIYDQHGKQIQYNVIPPGPGTAVSAQPVSVLSDPNDVTPIGSYEPPDAISAFAVKVMDRAANRNGPYSFTVEDLALDTAEIARAFPTEVATYRVDYSNTKKLTLNLPTELSATGESGIIFLFKSGGGRR